ncbi:POK9 protein, partial [Paradoxornis webbianus]|nr:POK9 protein [Sinosuthora webbiana]
GSAGLDLATSITITLLDSSVHLLPTGVFGPPGQLMHALLLGRSSTSLMGRFVLPGVIDCDSNNEIMILAWTPRPPCTIPQGTRIAQLILLSQSMSIPFTDIMRQRGFGSTGTTQVCWVQLILKQRPTCQCTLTLKRQKITLVHLIGTVADLTVIS